MVTIQFPQGYKGMCSVCDSDADQDGMVERAFAIPPKDNDPIDNYLADIGVAPIRAIRFYRHSYCQPHVEDFDPNVE